MSRIGFRVQNSRSWLSHEYGPIKSAKLAERLIEELAGVHCLFLTLTYDREPYASPLDLYRAALQYEHVKAFIRRLQEAIGESLVGRWICKLEFQEGGWLHWHLIVKAKRIDWYKLTDAWGHGHTRFDVATPEMLRYFCKYLSKDGRVPEFLYLEPARSVRVVRVSPGFWERTAEGSRMEVVEDGDGAEVESGAIGDNGHLPFYEPIGSVLARAKGTVLFKELDDGKFAPFKAGPCEVLDAIQAAGAKPIDCADGWLIFEGIDWDNCCEVAAALVAGRLGGGGVLAPAQRGTTPHRPAERSEAALYLNTNPEPGGIIEPALGAEPWAAPWLDRYFEFVVGWEPEDCPLEGVESA